MTPVFSTTFFLNRQTGRQVRVPTAGWAVHERKRHEHTLGDGFGVRIFDREDAMELVSRLEAPDLQANPVVSREGKVQPIYVNGAYLARNPRWHLEESAWKAVQIRRILRRNQISPATVCDVGCGAGEVLQRC